MEKRFARMTPEGVRMMPVPCNGWLDGRACSNLHRVFDRDTEAARKIFAKFKTCTRVYLEQYTKGIPVERLTVAG